MSGPTIHRDIIQHSPEWFAIKAGKWSASKAAVIMGGLDTKGLADLVQDIAWERVYGPSDDAGFKSPAMERGTITEAESRDWYCFAHNVEIEEVGFVSHATIPHVGWSPDGLIIGKRAGIEAKCPLHKAWMETLRTGKVPSQYRWQCKWGLWVGELDYLDFLSYHPKPASGLVVRCQVTDDEKQQMAERVALLETKVAEWVERLNNQRIAA